MCFRPPQVGEPIPCPNCGCMNPFNRTTCRKCKEPLNNGTFMIKCPACGKLNLPESDACDDCGLLIEDMRQKVVSGEITLDDLIVAADGSPVPGGAASVVTDLDAIGGGFRDDGVSVSAPAAPAAPTAPAAPSAPVPPGAPAPAAAPPKMPN